MGTSPSAILGLTAGSYEAYCLDQAVWHFGATLTSELDKAGQKRQKGEGRLTSARQGVLDRYLGKAKQTRFSDPAAFFT